MCIARALKSQVNVPTSTYSAATNPWKKFKEVVANDPFNAQNWVEAGNGGDYSYIRNATKINGLRKNSLSNRDKFRGCLKVSYNEYLAQLYPGQGHVVLICKGGMGYDPDPNDNKYACAAYIHTSTDLVNWSEPLMVKYDPQEENMRYPELVGQNDNNYPGFSCGWSGLTCQDNTLYYQIFRLNEDSPTLKSQHLYRRKLTFTITNP